MRAIHHQKKQTNLLDLKKKNFLKKRYAVEKSKDLNLKQIQDALEFSQAFNLIKIPAKNTKITHHRENYIYISICKNT